MKFLGHWVQKGTSSSAVSLPTEPEQCSMHTFDQGSTDIPVPKAYNQEVPFQTMWSIHLWGLPEKRQKQIILWCQKLRPLWGMGGGALLQFLCLSQEPHSSVTDPGSLPEWPLGPWSGQPSLKGLPERGKSFSVLLEITQCLGTLALACNYPSGQPGIRAQTAQTQSWLLPSALRSQFKQH